MMSARLPRTLATLAAAAALAVGANLIVGRLAPQAQLDLTQQKLYTLSTGTRQMLAGMKDPVTLRLFYSRRLGAQIPVYGSYYDRVREMLLEYVALSGGKLRLELFDPEPFSPLEDRALAYGLQGVALDQGGEQVYFGLVGTNQVDDERTIPFFQPDRERFLEYDLTRLLYEVSSPARPVLGVLSSLPLNGDPRAMMLRQPQLAQPAAVMTQLRQFFGVKDLPVDSSAIPPEVQVLIVVHPQNFSTQTQYAIDQFVMRGGKLILLVDPHSESQAARPTASGQPPNDTSSSLGHLLNAWGIEAPRDSVILDLRGAWRVRANPQDRVQAVDYPAWFNLSGDGLNKKEVALAQLDQITLASSGSVQAKAGSTLEFTPLLIASAQSMRVDASRVRDNPNPARLLADFKPDGETHVLGARFRGPLRSAFTGGPPPPAQGQEASNDRPAHRAETAGVANLVVINDTDILEDRFWVRVQDFFGQQVATPTSGNGAFIGNLSEMLAGSDALISLRSRGDSLRPFTAVDDLRRKADAAFRQNEQQLTAKLEATERRLRELRQGERAGGPTVITPSQRAEIDAARAEIVATRQQLRTVQLDLRRDIEALELRLRLLNIAAVPAGLVLCTLGLAAWRTYRRRSSRA